jgi:choloylglycine hydrolase
VNRAVFIRTLALCFLSAALLSAAVEPITASPQGACTAFCLDNGDHCIFGANQDNTVELGLLFINQRNVLKTTWDPGTSGAYVRWISRYGSVTVNFAGFQMAWAGMNEAGLMISTMSVSETRAPVPDERPPFQSPFWMQYQLDNHSTVEQVIASDADVRLLESLVDHFLVCDRTGACATIEFFDHKLVYHTGELLEVPVLTNSPYDVSLSTWKGDHLHADLLKGDSLWRFVEATNRVAAFEPSDADTAVAYAFDTLAAVARDDTVWSFVFDPLNLRVYFRTKHNPGIRYLDFSSLDFSCRTPARYLDVHADVSGDISGELLTYTHAAGFAHSTSFFEQFGGMNMSPILVDTLLWGLESFSCQGDDTPLRVDHMSYHPLIPVTVRWAGLTLWHRVGPFWIPMLLLSLAYIAWRMSVGQLTSYGKRIFWFLLTTLLGPFGLMAYLLIQRKKQQGKT